MQVSESRDEVSLVRSPCSVGSHWSWITSACSGLERGLGSQPETEAGTRWWKHQILATRPAVSDKGPGLQLCRKEVPQRWKAVEQVFFFFFFNWKIIANIVLASAIYQHESATSIHMYRLSWTSLPFHTPSYPSRSSQSTGLNSLYHIANSWLLAIYCYLFYIW